MCSGNRFSRRRWLQGGALVTAVAAVHASRGNTSLAISRDRRATTMRWDGETGNLFVAYDEVVEVLDDQTQRPLQSIEVGMEKVFDIALDSKCQRLLIAGGDPGEQGIVELREWPGGRLLHAYSYDGDVVTRVRWSSDDDRWLETDWHGSCRVRDIAEPHLVRFGGHARTVLAAAWSDSQPWLATSGVEPAIQIWNSENGTWIRSLDLHTRPVIALAFVRPDQAQEDYLISIGEDGTVRLWQPRIGRLVRFARLPSNPLLAEWMGQGLRVAVALVDGSVVEVDLEDLSIYPWVARDPNRIQAMTVSANRQKLCLARSSGLSLHPYLVHHGTSEETLRRVKDDE
jgi:WD40 repeat protein